MLSFLKDMLVGSEKIVKMPEKGCHVQQTVTAIGNRRRKFYSRSIGGNFLFSSSFLYLRIIFLLLLAPTLLLIPLIAILIR